MGLWADEGLLVQWRSGRVIVGGNFDHSPAPAPLHPSQHLNKRVKDVLKEPLEVILRSSSADLFPRIHSKKSILFLSNSHPFLYIYIFQISRALRPFISPNVQELCLMNPKVSFIEYSGIRLVFSLRLHFVARETVEYIIILTYD